MEDWHNQRINAAIEANGATFSQFGVARTALTFVPRLHFFTPQQNVARVRSLNTPVNRHVR
ncbi:hypothetical protein [Lactiplantibacillus modestisalitolerans]|uniref:Uncharacterized protein n=1 Tax=Lactiplantibacillus modestisalitolerans TaxID=1457219 RepID=A0ABV5WU14_9LACO|nr:hypothetical protein [Lactiplantibacillus modestisalitolerans]